MFAVRSGDDFCVLPGALTRLHESASESDADETNSKDTWVLADPIAPAPAPRQPRRGGGDYYAPRRQVMSRVADSFYWMGRYLERAYHQAYLISVVETLETEELNSSERKHYRPIWNRLAHGHPAMPDHECRSRIVPRVASDREAGVARAGNSQRRSPRRSSMLGPFPGVRSVGEDRCPIS